MVKPSEHSPRIVITSDGSPTLYTPQFNAHYHSQHGALQESLHVFIQEGLHHYIRLHDSAEPSILEYGMGTGLNVLLTWMEAQEKNLKLRYHALEGYPVAPELALSLELSDQLDQELFHKIHFSEWNKAHQFSDNFNFLKEEKLFEYFSSEEQFDVIYFDAFGPRSQPHLWTTEILQAAFDALNPHGILVTFCAQGAFKRNLREVGFTVERVPGPPGKREMTRATKLG